MLWKYFSPVKRKKCALVEVGVGGGDSVVRKCLNYLLEL